MTTTSTQPLHIDLRDPQTRRDIYALYGRLQTQEPVARAILTMSDEDAEDFSGAIGREVFLATGYDEAVEVLSDDRFSIDFRAVKSAEQLAALPPVPDEFLPLLHNLLSLDPPDHTRLRRLVQPSFMPRVMENLRPRVQAIADDLLDRAMAASDDRGEAALNRTIELVNDFAYPLPMIVISELLGVPEGDRAQVRAWSEAFLQTQTLTESTRQVLGEFTPYLRDLFAQKRLRPTDDLTSDLVHAEEEGDRLNEEELLSMVFILIVAGHVTTVHLIGSAVLALLNHPEQLARLRAEPELIKGTVEEALRYWGPVEMASPRFARENLELGGIAIARGEAVFPVLAAANRDPRRFPDPDHFDIGRPNAGRNIAFGRGVHLCLGAPLARIEGQVALATLFRRLPDLRLSEPIAEPPLHPSLFRGLDRLPLLY